MAMPSSPRLGFGAVASVTRPARVFQQPPRVARLPVLDPREVITILRRLGFEEVRQRGSHQQFRHTDGRVTTVPVHGGRDISPTLLCQIIKDVGLSPDEFSERASPAARTLSNIAGLSRKGMRTAR
jgi:predicted RNA binding protein YcfA (HicA-like mRNA interferase family)